MVLPPFIVPVYPFPPPFTSPEEELYALEAYKEELEAVIELLNRRIEELRLRSGIEQLRPIEVVEKPVPATPEVSEAPAAPRQRRRRETVKKKPAPPAKSEAERKVEQIMAEVEKVLARLEQMEVSE